MKDVDLGEVWILVSLDVCMGRGGGVVMTAVDTGIEPGFRLVFHPVPRCLSNMEEKNHLHNESMSILDVLPK